MKKIRMLLVLLGLFQFPQLFAQIDSVYLQELSLFWAGKNVAKSSSLHPLTQDVKYRAFRKGMHTYWSNYEKNQVAPLKNWQRRWNPGETLETCFYPFAGADLMNAYLVYPKAKTYILIGLEKGGIIPDLPSMGKTNFHRGMAMMLQGYKVFMKYNFYRTLGMQVDLDKSPFTGTAPHMVSQMGMLNLVPLSASRVVITPHGKLEFKPLRKGEFASSVSLEFKTPAGELKRVIYIQLDLSDEALKKNPVWKAWLESLPPSAGVLKAASYLLHMQGFDQMRALVREKMYVLVQDDSGMPFHWFKDNYDVTLFGKYAGPNSVFPSRIQEDLIRAYERGKSHAMDFQFNYNMRDGLRNMMLIRKKE